MTRTAALTDTALAAIFDACLADDAITKRRSAFHNANLELAQMLGEGAIDKATFYASIKRMRVLYGSC